MKLRKLAAVLATVGIAAAALAPSVYAVSDSPAIYPSSGFVAGFDAQNVDYSDELFAQSSVKYSPELAKFASLLSASEYLVGGETRMSQDILEKSGFDNITDCGSYRKMADAGEQECDLAGYTFAHKKVGRGDETFDLICVCVCGTNGVSGWYSNFNVGTGKRHSGFNAACTELEKDLDEYAAGLEISMDSSALLICGHSRGAAVSNLLAADMTNAAYGSGETGALDTALFGGLSADKIYAYTFATPNVEMNDGITVDIADETSKYANIFNIINPNDFVPQMPLYGWGYSRYGKQVALPSELTAGSVGYEIYLDAMDENFDSLGFGDYSDHAGRFPDSKAVSAFRELAEDIASPEEYYEKNIALIGKKVTAYSFFRDGIVGMLAAGGADGYTETMKVIASGTLSPVFTEFMTYFVKGIWDSSLIYAHAPQTYIAGTMTLNSADDLLSGEYTHISVSANGASADVNVVNSDGITVAYAANGKSESIKAGVYCSSGKTEIYLPLGEAYTITHKAAEKELLDTVIQRENAVTGKASEDGARLTDVQKALTQVIITIDEDGNYQMETEEAPEPANKDEIVIDQRVPDDFDEPEPSSLDYPEPEDTDKTPTHSETDRNPPTSTVLPLTACIISAAVALITHRREGR